MTSDSANPADAATESSNLAIEESTGASASDLDNELAERSGADPQVRRSLSWLMKVAVGYAGVALPIACHLFTAGGPVEEPTWQSGELADMWGFLLSSTAGWPLYLFLLYPVVCLAWLLFDEPTAASKRLVRFGIYTGVPVTAWYGCVFAITVGDGGTWEFFAIVFGSILALVVLWGVLKLLLYARRRLNVSWVHTTPAIGFLLLVLSAIFATNAARNSPSWTEYFVNAATMTVTTFVLSPIYLFFVSLFFSTYWCCVTYVGMSIRLNLVYPRPARFYLLELMGWTTWLAGFLATIRWTITLSLAEYAKLPLESPGSCYIATAAASGHSRFVGSSERETKSGVIIRVSRQLETLKAGEVAIKSLAPSLHRVMRSVYDRFGPKLARQLSSPLRADVAFLLLKPFEWVAYFSLRCLLGSRGMIWVRRCYGKSRLDQRRDDRPLT